MLHIGRALACSVTAQRLLYNASHLPQFAVVYHLLSHPVAPPSHPLTQHILQPLQQPQLAGAAPNQHQQLPTLRCLWRAILHSNASEAATPCYSQRHGCNSHDPASSTVMPHFSFSRGYRTNVSRRQNISATSGELSDVVGHSSPERPQAPQQSSYRQSRDSDQQFGGRMLHQQQQKQQWSSPSPRRKLRRPGQAADMDSAAHQAASTLGHKQHSSRKRQWQHSSVEDDAIHWQPQGESQRVEQPWRQHPNSGIRDPQKWVQYTPQGPRSSSSSSSSNRQQRRSRQWGPGGSQGASSSQDTAAAVRHSSRDTDKPQRATAAAAAVGYSSRDADKPQRATAAAAAAAAAIGYSSRDTYKPQRATAAAAAVGYSSRDTDKPQRATAAAAGSTALDPVALTKAIGGTRSLPQLQQLLHEYKDHLQQINVCAAFKAVVRLATSHSSSSSSSSSNAELEGAVSGNRPGAAALAIMRQLSSRMQSQIRTARPWDLAQAAWACSKLQYREQALLNSIAQQTIRKAPILLPQDVAQLASAYSRLKYPHKQLMELLQQQTVVKADAFEPWSLVHTAWSLEVAGASTSFMLELLTAISKQLGPQQVQKLQALDVATLLWLMASHEYYNQQLLEAVGQQLAAQLPHYPPAAVAQALISVAGLGYYDPDLAATAVTVVQQQLVKQQYSPKQIAQTTFALVKLGHASPELLDAAAAAFVGSSAGSYSPGLLCMLCWATLLGGYRSEKFTERMVQECHSQLPHFTADQIASIMRGMLKLPGWSDNLAIIELLSAAAAQLPQQLPDMALPVLGKLIIALSKQHQYSRQQFVQHWPQQQEGQQSTASPVLNTTAVSNDVAESEQQQQQLELQVLLQQCGQEWLQRQQQQQQLGRVTQKQVDDVRVALAAAGMSEITAAIEEVDSASTSSNQQEGSHRDLQDTRSAEDSDHLVVPAAAAAATAAQQGSWLDSFVASGDEK